MAAPGIPLGSLPAHPGSQIEDYPSGYPQFSALLSAHPAFTVFRRFTLLRTRLLLHKQDKLVTLEEELELVDASETRPLFRGCLRRDANQVRADLMGRIDTALQEYETMIQRHEQFLARQGPSVRELTNLRNWVGETACIASEETAYLWKDDVMTLNGGPAADMPPALEAVIEDVLIWMQNWSKRIPLRPVSRNPNVYVFSRQLVAGLARGVIACLLVAVLIMPAVLLLVVHSTVLQLLVVLAFCILFFAMLSTLTKARTAETFMAGAAYAAVVVVFLSGNGNKTE